MTYYIFFLLTGTTIESSKRLLSIWSPWTPCGRGVVPSRKAPQFGQAFSYFSFCLFPFLLQPRINSNFFLVMYRVSTTLVNKQLVLWFNYKTLKDQSFSMVAIFSCFSTKVESYINHQKGRGYKIGLDTCPQWCQETNSNWK